ncbi:MAG: response regulator [Desulfovibrionaceae bacterium]|nr:response regulator [Desulfovibrionaceae bacterium]MBF0514960.1 response regulator [Desulfovibrionaceae bacterium]
MARPFKILIVDDEPVNITLIQGCLKNMGYEVHAAENAFDALKVLDRSFDLVLADVMMPEMDGFAMVRKIRSNPETLDIPVVMVTALHEKDYRLKAVETGANDFISKPVDRVELKIRTESMLRQKAQQDEIKSFSGELNTLVEARTLELRHVLAGLNRANKEAIQHLSAAAEFKDEDTGFHILRMASYSALIAAKLGLDKEDVDMILTSSPMHDVGKIGIPDSILLKPAKLDAGEWKIMKEHTTIGGQILGAGESDYMNMGTIIALAHHEKWDGSGYPSGLAGEDIPLPGRICAVADVFDALTSKRPYKQAFAVDKSLEIMKEGRGSHFDPRLLDIFLENIGEALEIREKYLEV